MVAPPQCKVFLPLVDITIANGPTEVKPGSHFLSRDLTRLTLLAKVTWLVVKAGWSTVGDFCVVAAAAAAAAVVV